MIKNTPAIDVRNLTTKYGNKLIHNNITFSIKRNTICSLIGGSGSGKTTLLKALLGLLTPVCGSIKIFEQEINRLNLNEQSLLRKKTAVLFQEGALFSGLTVEDNITFPLEEQLTISKKTKKFLVRYWLNQVGLDADVGAKMPSELSGGMKKRVGLARALILEPELLFLDEPTSGLDPISARNFDRLIRNLQRDINITIIMISHDINSIQNLSDQIVALGNQKIIADGTPSEVLESPNSWIQEYFNNKITTP